MAKLHGKEALIYNGAQKIVSVTDLNVTVQDKQVDSTDHDSGGWEECIGGNKSWSATSTHNKVLADASQDAVFDALTGTTQLAIVIYPDGVASGRPQYQGNCLVTKWDYKAPNTGIQTMDIALQGIGALTRSLQP